jgi:hypothetical protein
MIIFKCFTCSFESNNKTILKSKTIGRVYTCPECKQSYGCLVETETQMEFQKDYILTFIKNKVTPIYYGNIIKDINKDSHEVALQVFEIINIPKGIFTYGYVNVPGMFTIIGGDSLYLLLKDCAIIQPIGENVLTTIESRNPKNQISLYIPKPADNFKNENTLIKTNVSQSTKSLYQSKLEEENNRLIENLYKLDIYNIISFDINYLLNSPLNFKTTYKLPRPLITRLKKKYNVTKIITYHDLTHLNSLWHTYDIHYLGLPSLNNIMLWLQKAWRSKSVCCGVVPFAPLSDWYKEFIIDKAEIRLLKQQKGIPFPLVEFNYRYQSKKKMLESEKTLLTKTDKQLGQQMFGFAKKK